MSMADTSSHYGSTQTSAPQITGDIKQQSLLSAPPHSLKSAATPELIETSSIPIVNNIHKCSKIIIYIYIVFGIAAVVMTILELVAFQETVLFLILVLGTILLSLAGACGVYKWGTVATEIDRFKGENSKFESQVVHLTTVKHRIKDEVISVQHSVEILKKNVDHLKDDLHAYDKLKEELQDIAGDNEDLNDMIQHINEMYSSMKSAVIQNQRSWLFQKYYEVQLRDKSNGLSKAEYRRFKAKLDKETRERFDKKGDFDRFAGVDHVINLAEFSSLLENIIGEMEEELLRSA